MTGPVSMVIILSDGKQMRRHIDHVRARGCEEVVPVTSEDKVFPRRTLDTSEVVSAEPVLQTLSEPVPDAPAEPTVNFNQQKLLNQLYSDVLLVYIVHQIISEVWN